MTKSTITYNAKGDLLPGVVFCTVTNTGPATVTFTQFGAINKNGTGGGPTEWVETTPTPPAWIGGGNYEIIAQNVNSGGPGQPGFPVVGDTFSIARTWALTRMGANTGRWVITVTIRNNATGATANYDINLQSS